MTGVQTCALPIFRSVNALANTPTIVGSGTIGVWVDGQTIQVGAAAGGTTLLVVQQDLYTSGYVRNVDLLGSGYVRSINGLKNTPTLVASGSTTIWVDGQTIQIASAGGATFDPISDPYLLGII